MTSVLNVRIEDDGTVILSNFGRLMDNPAHFDAAEQVKELLDEGHRSFIFELSNFRTVGSSALGLLMTLTRTIRRSRGDAVLVKVRPGMAQYFDEMGMDAYWDMFSGIDEAREFLNRDHLFG